jgi:O-acetyl-ADP-ribose deacetylase (regulator of RNase III)
MNADSYLVATRAMPKSQRVIVFRLGVGSWLTEDHTNQPDVIHTVGPIYYKEGRRAPTLLRLCYAKSLALADEHDLESVAIPSISTGVYGFVILYYIKHLKN